MISDISNDTDLILRMRHRDPLYGVNITAVRHGHGHGLVMDMFTVIVSVMVMVTVTVYLF
jgi:hypothetical protein